MTLLPYLVAEAAHSVKARTPLMRAMLLDHPDLENVGTLWDQYRYGRDLLVAPVISPDALSRPVVLPAGNWWHLLDEEWHAGGRRQEIAAPLRSIPIFARYGTLLPLSFTGEMRFGAPGAVGLEDVSQLVLLLIASAPC